MEGQPTCEPTMIPPAEASPTGPRHAADAPQPRAADAGVVRPSERKAVLRGFQGDRATTPDATIKHRVLNAVEELLQDSTFADVMERLYFLHKIDKGLKQAEADETISHEEAKECIKTWHA
jgi:hypothetical protein